MQTHTRPCPETQHQHWKGKEDDSPAPLPDTGRGNPNYPVQSTVELSRKDPSLVQITQDTQAGDPSSTNCVFPEFPII